jgi:hypothetical protein
VLGSAALCSGAASAQAVDAHVAVVQAGVVFPVPGAMSVSGLPSQVPADHTFTLREDMPLAVWSGKVRLQVHNATGGWSTLTSAHGLRLFWLHWKVPSRLAGSRLAVRFVLVSGRKVLAVSRGYGLVVAP